MRDAQHQNIQIKNVAIQTQKVNMTWKIIKFLRKEWFRRMQLHCLN